MKKEEKDLLIKDLCERLPYGVKMLFNNEHKFTLDQMNPRQYSGKDGRGVIFDFGGKVYSIEDCKPFLRPMSSMTEKEKDDLLRFFSFPLGAMYFNSDWGYVEVFDCIDEVKIYINDIVGLIDWLNMNMFDFRGLIPKGLALEAPEGMYSK